MTEGHRLRALKMGEAGHDGRGLGLGAFDQRGLQVLDARVQGVDGAPNPQLEVRRHLIVARPRRVQAARGRADQRRQAVFHVHVDVFQSTLEFEITRGDFRLHGRKPHRASGRRS